MSEPLSIRLQPKQGKLFDLLASSGPNVPTLIGAGGAKGSGKSKGARSIAILLAAELGKKYPGVVITLVRRVAADLRDNHIEPMFRDHPELYAHWRATDHDLVLEKGSRIIFRSAERAEDVKKRFLGGFESAIIIVDEAQQFTQEELQWIQTAARWTGVEGIPEGLCKTLLLFNPGGPGSDYIRRVFWLRDYRDKERAQDHAFIHMFGWDNYEWFRGQVDLTEKEFYEGPIPGRCGGASSGNCCRYHIFIRDTSEGRKYDQFPASIRAGYLEGSFDHFEGQYFAGAWDEQLCVISSATVARLWQHWWTHWMATDWGWAAPPKPHYSVNLWASIGKCSPRVLLEVLGITSDYPLDVMIVWQERFACLTPEPEWAQQIVDATPKHIVDSMARHFVDGSVFSKDRRSENTTADLMQPVLTAAGLPRMVPADKDRIGGWRQLYNAFVRTNRARRQPVTEPLEGPLLFIAADCPQIASSVPRLICDTEHGKPEDVLKTESLEDDVMDTLRYLYKSMQSAQWEAPVEVRRAEVFAEYDVPEEERSGEQMTSLALAVKRFDSAEKAKYKRVKTRR